MNGTEAEEVGTPNRDVCSKISVIDWMFVFSHNSHIET